jgi:hypothetical protein
VNHLQSHAGEAREAVESWSFIHSRQALSLEDPVAAMPLMRLFRAAGFPIQAMVIRVQASAEQVSECHADLKLKNDIEELRTFCIEALHSDVRVEQVRPRRGFPRRYLMLGRNALTGVAAAPSAGFCMREVHGFLFAMLVFHAYKIENK